MRKTSVYLTKEEAEQLRRVSVREGRPQAELIREGVRHVIAGVARQPREFRSLGVGHGGGKRPGRWSSGELHDKAMGRE